MKKRFGKWILIGFLFLLSFFIVRVEDRMREDSRVSLHVGNPEESEEFRELEFSPESMDYIEQFSKREGIPLAECVCVFLKITEMKANRIFSFIDTNEFERTEYEKRKDLFQKEQSEEWERLKKACEAIWADVVYFPIPDSSMPGAATVYYENGWGSERVYQDASHIHEGCDIMAGNNERGYFPVVSMTDGVVERIGWLEKGGWRIGIRSPHGGYFYYAHLYRYGQDFKEGDTVKAGQLLGFMGDTGYSKVEGTVGNFAVHLHLGIYIETEHYVEQSVNPYWILRYLEKNKLTCVY